MIKKIIRALRLPFLTASVLPFCLGSFISLQNFNLTGFMLGLIAVVFTHLGANLINDYSDFCSGADCFDKNYYPFFGGSKLIQEGVFPEKFYLCGAFCCIGVSFLSVIFLSFILNSFMVVLIYLFILLLSWQYSAKPLQFSYHYLGELFIFILFGPAIVMGGYFIQTGIFPDFKSLIISLPPGFFTAAILFANEIPDFNEDQRANKNNLVKIAGLNKAYLIYFCLILLGLASVAYAVLFGYLKVFVLFSFISVVPAFKSAVILKKYAGDKEKLLQSSAITINMQMAISIILILGLIL